MPTQWAFVAGPGSGRLMDPIDKVATCLVLGLASCALVYNAQEVTVVDPSPSCGR